MNWVPVYLYPQWYSNGDCIFYIIHHNWSHISNIVVDDPVFVWPQGLGILSRPVHSHTSHTWAILVHYEFLDNEIFEFILTRHHPNLKCLIEVALKVITILVIALELHNHQTSDSNSKTSFANIASMIDSKGITMEMHWSLVIRLSPNQHWIM